MQKSILVAVDKWKYIAKYKTRIKRTKKLMVLSLPCGLPLLISSPIIPTRMHVSDSCSFWFPAFDPWSDAGT